MKNFREKLYSKYSSHFKEHISVFDEKAIANTKSTYGYQFGPILKDFKKDAQILELGCGRGTFLEFLLNNGYNNIMGIDTSKEQIDLAKQKNLKAEQISVKEYLEKNNNKFDLIFAIDLIEHFYKDEIINLLELVYNNLNTGGAFVFRTPNGLGLNSNRLIYGDLTHLTIFTPNSAIQILRIVGFNKTKFFETEPHTRNLIGVFRVVLWKIIKFISNIIRLIETGGTESILTQNFIGISFKDSKDS